MCDIDVCGSCDDDLSNPIVCCFVNPLIGGVETGTLVGVTEADEAVVSTDEGVIFYLALAAVESPNADGTLLDFMNAAADWGIMVDICKHVRASEFDEAVDVSTEQEVIL